MQKRGHCPSSHNHCLPFWVMRRRRQPFFERSILEADIICLRRHPFDTAPFFGGGDFIICPIKVVAVAGAILFTSLEVPLELRENWYLMRRRILCFLTWSAIYPVWLGCPKKVLGHFVLFFKFIIHRFSQNGFFLNKMRSIVTKCV